MGWIIGLAALVLGVALRVGLFIGAYILRRGAIPVPLVILLVISNLALVLVDEITGNLRGEYYATEHLESSQRLRPLIARFSAIRALLWLFHIALFVWIVSGI